MENYRKLREIGKGSFGCVNLYEKKDTNEFYAIKEVPIKGKNKKDIKRIENEGVYLKRINSLYVVKCYDFFIENGISYIVLQYCSHGTLRDFLEENKKLGSCIKEDTIWRMFLQICLGLGAFHSNKIIHRDLKPENIFMFDRNTLKIGDTGLSKDLSTTNSTTTTSAGTSLYSPPEVLNN